MAILMKRFVMGMFLTALLVPIGKVNAQERVGVAVSSVNDVQGTLGGEIRQIIIGENLLQDEVIVTGPNSSTQLLFLDETTLTMGENSKLMLDELVYDPNDSMKLSKMLLTPIIGVIRFASGNSDKEVYQMKTNVGTIGVRGTVFSVVTQPKITTVVLERGAVIMTNLDGISAVLDKPGLSMSLVAAKRNKNKQSGALPKALPPTPPAPPPAAIAAKIATVISQGKIGATVPKKVVGKTLKVKSVISAPIKRTITRKILQKWCAKIVKYNCTTTGNFTTCQTKMVRRRC